MTEDDTTAVEDEESTVAEVEDTTEGEDTTVTDEAETTGAEAEDKYITPFLSTPWSAIFLPDENITVYSIVGLVIMILGIFIQLKDKNKELK